MGLSRKYLSIFEMCTFYTRSIGKLMGYNMYMSLSQRITLVLLRVGLGWLFLYAGITKVLDPKWSAAPYIKNAIAFHYVYAWLGSASNIGWVNFLNEWGLTLIGVALIVGIFIRYVSLAGILLMLLYYLPILSFPHVGDHSYIVDEHIIYSIGFLILITFNAGRYWGFDSLRR